MVDRYHRAARYATTVMRGAISLVTFAPAMAAAQCENVLAFSKLEASAVRNQQDFDRQADDFCRGYAEEKRKAGSAGGTFSYSDFRIGGDATNASTRLSAEQVCKRADAAQVRSDAYQTYAETIAPGAYAAYSDCLKMRSNLVFGTPVVLAREASITVAFTPRNTGQQASLTALGMGGAECKWYEIAGRKMIGSAVVLDRPATVLLRCTRQDAASPATVQIFDAAGTDSAGGMVLPWLPYRDGRPQSAFEDLAKRQEMLESALSNTVLAVRATTCPLGFVPWVEGQGRFLRGIDPTGKIDPDGVRAPGSVQAGDIQSHRHGITAPANRTGNPSEAVDSTPQSQAGLSTRNYWRGNRAATANEQTQTVGGPETRPANIAVSFCVAA